MTKTALTADILIGDGLTSEAAEDLLHKLNDLPTYEDARDHWAAVSRQILSPKHPFVVHERLFNEVYGNWNVSHQGPAPAWLPSQDTQTATRLGNIIAKAGCRTESEFRAWALAKRTDFWAMMTDALDVPFFVPPTQTVDLKGGLERPRWYPGARLNIADSCLKCPAEAAIRQYAEGKEPQTLTIEDLKTLSGRVAAGLVASGLQPGDAVGVLLPMNIEAVAVLLGIIRAGCAAVLVAESFAPPEIEQRFRLGGAKLIITQEALVRKGAHLDLYGKVADIPLLAIVIPSGGNFRLRPGDRHWRDFLAEDGEFESVPRSPSDHAMILFSSGTTGDPKVIPWSHTTPIKAAADGMLYQDIGPEDVVAWPTSPGWMMGPWLIFATLVNGGTIALYDDYPAGEGFCRFVEEAGVTVLGLVPSLVLAWKEGDLPAKYDWSRIKLFSSTGECSRPIDALYLMSRAGYRPIIEYCGGTEIGGGYITSSLLLPNSPGVFNTVAYGLDIDLRDEEGDPSNPGEGFLVGPSIGLSTELIGRDHHAVYYQDTPEPGLRRHGDRLERLPGGFWRVLGRADDTMNLGGIKVSAVEIERVLDRHPLLRESAAVASEDPNGGPTRLVAYVVLHDPAADTGNLQRELQTLVKERLNPLFRLSEVIPIESLPRTASNKVMRRLLRN